MSVHVRITHIEQAKTDLQRLPCIVDSGQMCLNQFKVMHFLMNEVPASLYNLIYRIYVVKRDFIDLNLQCHDIQ